MLCKGLQYLYIKAPFFFSSPKDWCEDTPQQPRMRLHRRLFTTFRPLRFGKSLSSKVSLTIDDIPVEVEAGSAIIQAAELAGVAIPRYCYHDKLNIAGNCRMCLVDVERMPKLIASCAVPVAEGMKVHTDSERVKQAREGVTEMLLQNHPLDCPVCDQGGECDLQDQSMRYGKDVGRFREITGKRAVENKAMGPLVKTSMNRCIHCTRCIRFLNDVAGSPELGSAGRGNDLQIGTFIERNINSELSGNIIDLCPVGALTSKPYAFKARPWELKRTESIDVSDAVGSNICIDARGAQVMRILPRLNDNVNETWISDKTRFSADALSLQRLTRPLVKVGGSFVDVTWHEALSVIAKAFVDFAPKKNQVQGVAGALADVESLVALKDLVNRLDSDNLVPDTPVPVKLSDSRAAYTFDFEKLDQADQILLVGTNPRHEAAVLNARIRKRWLESDLEVHSVGESFDSTYDINQVGANALDLKKILKGDLGFKLARAKNPMIIVGSGVAFNKDADAIFQMVGRFADDHSCAYSFLHRDASRAGAMDIGFYSQDTEATSTSPQIVFLLGADEVENVPENAFVVYVGHHGDKGASLADVVLPAPAFTEKSVTFVNTEGRVQVTRAATNPPGAARIDWMIFKAISEYLSVPLPYEDSFQMRQRISEIAPHLLRHDIVEPVSDSIKHLALKSVMWSEFSDISGDTLKVPIDNFYFTSVISRNSPTMAKCVNAFGGKIDKVFDSHASENLAII